MTVVLSDTEIPYSSDINENPNMSGVMDTQINEHLNLIEFQREFEDQYTTLHPIGFNIFKAYPDLELPIEIIDDFLEYVHVNVVPIPDYDIPNLALSKKEFLAKVVYEILLIDIPTKETFKFDKLDAESVRSSLLNTYGLYIDIIKEIPGQSWDKVKAYFALDLFDADLEQFIERYLIPILNKDT